MAVAQFLDELTGPSATERIIAELEASGELPDCEQRSSRKSTSAHSSCCSRRSPLRRANGESGCSTSPSRLFGDLGHEHPLTMRYRRQLAATLY